MIALIVLKVRADYLYYNFFDKNTGICDQYCVNHNYLLLYSESQIFFIFCLGMMLFTFYFIIDAFDLNVDCINYFVFTIIFIIYMFFGVPNTIKTFNTMYVYKSQNEYILNSDSYYLLQTALVVVNILILLVFISIFFSIFFPKKKKNS